MPPLKCICIDIHTSWGFFLTTPIEPNIKTPLRNAKITEFLREKKSLDFICLDCQDASGTLLSVYNDEDGDGGHAAGGEKMVMVALRNPSKCLWTLKLFKPTLERRQAAAQQQCILGNAVHSGEKLGV